MSAYLGFMAVAAAAMCVPGPDTFVVLRTALRDGSRAGAWAAGGAATGNLVWGSASVLGVSGVLAASASAFTVLKLAGAAYLLWLGVQALVAAARGTTFTAEERTPGRALARGQAFRRGLASDLLNVKVGLFWTALVPQFLHVGAGALLPVAMIASMGALVFGWLTVYALVASRVRHGLTRPAVSRAINAILGAAFVAVGGRLALTSR
jgi:threonine/homoserine/homoserine lactone efflux protein